MTYFSFISFLLESDILVTYFSFISFTSLVGYPIYILLFQFYEFPIVPPPPEPHLLPVKSIQYLIHTDYYLPKIAFWIFQCFHNVCAYPWLRFKLFIKFITLDFRFFFSKNLIFDDQWKFQQSLNDLHIFSSCFCFQSPKLVFGKYT